MKYQTIYFDLDGTLTDSGPGIKNGLTYTYTQMGKPIPTDAELRKYIGPPLTDSFVRFAGLNPQEVDTAMELFQTYYAKQGKFENSPYPGMIELLKKLREDGKILAVATSKPEPFAREILDHFGLSPYLHYIVGGIMSEVGMSKSQIIAKAISMAGREKPIMVGDRHFDVNGARDNNLDCIGVLFGYGDRAELEKAGAVEIAETVEDLLHILEA